jgi:hypothetical protein
MNALRRATEPAETPRQLIHKITLYENEIAGRSGARTHSCRQVPRAQSYVAQTESWYVCAARAEPFKQVCAGAIRLLTRSTEKPSGRLRSDLCLLLHRYCRLSDNGNHE